MKRAGLGREASAELAEAAAWYDEQRQGLGSAFLDAVEEVLSAVAERPASFPQLERPSEPLVRRALVQRFPYALVFVELGGGESRVIAVAHAKRDPRYWIQRLG